MLGWVGDGRVDPIAVSEECTREVSWRGGEGNAVEQTEQCEPQQQEEVWAEAEAERREIELGQGAG